MLHFFLILSLVLHVHNGESVNAALDSARSAYSAKGERTTILIDPGTYQEELTIDIPGLTLKNASKKPSIGLRNHGVDCDPNAVRLTWYYGHGYQYASMGERINYGGKRERRWNASVLVTAPDFTAENIIFENSFNLYVSEREAADSLVDISQSPMPWTEKERPKKVIPARPKTIGSTEVQQKRFRERASSISFTETATNAHLVNCRAVGRQDVVYGDLGASVYWEKGILQGAVDFIFGGMCFCADRATIVANINGEPNDKCYIAAGRSGEDGDKNHGMFFYRCHIRLATDDELQITNHKSQITNHEPMVWLARPWRYWGETVWAYTTWEQNILNPDAWSTGLTKGQACPNSYEYRSQDKSVGRPDWVTVLTKPRLPDATKLKPKKWFSNPQK